MPDSEVAVNIKHLSPSGASTWRQCQRKWHFAYVVYPDRRGAPTEPTLVGTFVHQVLEDLMALPPDDRTRVKAQEISKATWESFAEDDEYLSVAAEYSPEQVRAFKMKCWSKTMALWDEETPSEVDVVSVEQRVKVEIDGVPFLGMIDRVDRSEARGGLVVTDYKTGKAPAPKWVGDKLLQVTWYAAAIQEIEGERPTYAQLMFLGSKTHGRAMTAGWLRAGREILVETWEDIHTTTKFTPSTGPLCNWCDFESQCPEGAKAATAWRKKKGITK